MHLEIILICRSVLYVPKGDGEGRILFSLACILNLENRYKPLIFNQFLRERVLSGRVV